MGTGESRDLRDRGGFQELVELAEGVYEAACESAVDWAEGLGSYVLLVSGEVDSLACAPLGLMPEPAGPHLVHALRPLVGGAVSGAILCAALPEAAASGRDARRVMVLLRARDGRRWMRQATYARLDDGVVRIGEWNDDLRNAPDWIRAYWDAELFA